MNLISAVELILHTVFMVPACRGLDVMTKPSQVASTLQILTTRKRLITERGTLLGITVVAGLNGVPHSQWTLCRHWGQVIRTGKDEPDKATRQPHQPSMYTTSSHKFQPDSKVLDVFLHSQQAYLEGWPVAEENDNMGNAGAEIMPASLMHDDTNLSTTPSDKYEVPGHRLASDCGDRITKLQSGAELPASTTLLSMPHAGDGLVEFLRQPPVASQASQARNQEQVSL